MFLSAASIVCVSVPSFFLHNPDPQNGIKKTFDKMFLVAKMCLSWTVTRSSEKSSLFFWFDLNIVLHENQFFPYRKTCSDVCWYTLWLLGQKNEAWFGAKKKKSFNKKNQTRPLHVCCALTLTAHIVLDIKARHDGRRDKRNVGRKKEKMRRHECKSTVWAHNCTIHFQMSFLAWLAWCCLVSI